MRERTRFSSFWEILQGLSEVRISRKEKTWPNQVTACNYKTENLDFLAAPLLRFYLPLRIQNSVALISYLRSVSGQPSVGARGLIGNGFHSGSRGFGNLIAWRGTDTEWKPEP